jgi:uridine kinase
VQTTLAHAIYKAIGKENISFISHDSYYKDLSHLPMAERECNNFDHPDSLDTNLLIEHVEALKNRRDVHIPTYDFSTHSRCTETEHLLARPVVLVEGILIFADPRLYNLLDIRMFVDTDDDIRFIRRVSRDTKERGRTLQGVIDQVSTRFALFVFSYPCLLFSTSRLFAQCICNLSSLRREMPISSFLLD